MSTIEKSDILDMPDILATDYSLAEALDMQLLAGDCPDERPHEGCGGLTLGDWHRGDSEEMEAKTHHMHESLAEDGTCPNQVNQ